MDLGTVGHSFKTMCILNVEGFYDDLIKFIQLTTSKGFSKARFTDVLMNFDSIDEILARFETYQAPEPKWGVKDREELVRLEH